MPVDYGRGEAVALLALKVRTIGDLVAQGHGFVTIAFYPGAAPTGVRMKDVEAIKARLRKEGCQVAITSA